jgi:hypothetical protein
MIQSVGSKCGWSNPAGRSDIHLIVISGQSTWTAPGSMRLGQTLDQVGKTQSQAVQAQRLR